ncbi:hypothetical protein MMC15_004776 [Xylographa vitiligo]|nr:hypothetical protein [Xylographa vitiligo]
MSKMKAIYEPLSSKEGNALLEEKASETSSDDGFPPTYVSPTKRRDSWLRVVALHATVIVCYSLIITAVLTRYITHKENLGPGLIYTPARPVLGYYLRPPIPDTTNKLHGDPFFGDPSPELDMRWNIRLESASIRLSQEEFEKYNQSHGILLGDGSGDYLATPTMYHDLHCIEFLHQSIYPDHYWPNDTLEKKEGRAYHARECLSPTYSCLVPLLEFSMRSHVARVKTPQLVLQWTGHCLHNIAHSVTCGADMTIRIMQWLPDQLLPNPVDHEHECRSEGAINQWAYKRRVNTRAPGMLVHPILGEVFPDGQFKGDDDDL